MLTDTQRNVIAQRIHASVDELTDQTYADWRRCHLDGEETPQRHDVAAEARLLLRAITWHDGAGIELLPHLRMTDGLPSQVSWDDVVDAAVHTALGVGISELEEADVMEIVELDFAIYMEVMEDAEDNLACNVYNDCHDVLDAQAERSAS